MDQDTPVPSIEYDDLPTMSITQSQETNTRQNPPRAFNRMSLDSAAATPLPPSSPLKSPHKTPKPQQYASSPKPENSRSPNSASHYPTNHDRQSTPPILQTKRSTPSLNGARGLTPSKPSYFRRASSTLNPTSSCPMPVESKPPVTAASVAQDYFQKELDMQNSSAADSETVVFVHDSCYGHRFSRPRTSKAALATIVERPERIHATILGASAAYVRLGDRHHEGRHGPHPRRDPSIAPPFTIRKTSRSIALDHPSVTHVHGAKWMEELQIMCDSAEGKLALNGKELVRPIGYGKDENGVVLPKLHEGDLYLSAESLNALQGCLGGVCDAVDSVFAPNPTKRAFVSIRPPGHHCSSNFPSGFCWLNNVHVGIAYAAMNQGLTHAAIIDFDLHHGDGSQSIVWNHNRQAQNLHKHAPAYKKTPIGYFSIHDINSYPCEMGDEDKVRNASLCIENAHGQSIWNVHLEPWRNHTDFWRLYETRYSILLEKTRVFLHHHAQKFNSMPNGPKAKAAIFLSAGFDASEWEGAGMQRHSVNVPTDFYAKFTADVVKLAEEEGLGVDGRVISVLEGGYSDRALMSGVFSHICGLTTQSTKPPVKGRLNGSSSDVDVDQAKPAMSYDPEWWTDQHLELLESRVHPRDLPFISKKMDKHPGNYTSPTQASTAKITDQAFGRRSLSAQLEGRLALEPEPELPPPAVDWATAAYELSRLIIPKDRQTLSCRHEELNAEATRARRERQSTIGLPMGNEEKMQLRDRKAKPLPFEAPSARPASRNDKRRTTIAAVADLPDPGFSSNGGMETANGRPRRRSSAGSSIVSGFQDMHLNESERRRIDESRDDRSSRAPSVLPTKAPKPPIVKKTRVAPVPKPAPKPRASPKKATAPAPPVPRVPSTFLQRSRSGRSSGDEIVTDELSSQARSGSADSVVRADDVDSLSTGMKKMSIKLKVRSPEELTAKEAATVEEKPKKPRAPRKPPVPKAPKVTKPIPSKTQTATTNLAVTSDAKAESQSQSESSLAGHVNQLDNSKPLIEASQPVVSAPSGGDLTSQPTFIPTGPVSRSESAQAETVPNEPPVLDARSPVELTSVFSQVIDIAETTPNTNVSVARASPSEPLLPQIPTETPLKAVAPTVLEFKPSTGATPGNSKKTRDDLPMFTSSSPIPFAKSAIPIVGQAMSEYSAEGGPASKKTVDPVPLGLGIREEEAPAQRGADAGSNQEIKLENSSSIWDIPETPQR